MGLFYKFDEGGFYVRRWGDKGIRYCMRCLMPLLRDPQRQYLVCKTCGCCVNNPDYVPRLKQKSEKPFMVN